MNAPGRYHGRGRSPVYVLIVMGWRWAAILVIVGLLGLCLTLEGWPGEAPFSEQPYDLGRVDPMAGLAPQLLADRLSDVI
jgi:hypothetical protein